VCVSLHMSVFMCVCLSVCVSQCLCLSLSVCVSLFQCECVSLSLCVSGTAKVDNNQTIYKVVIQANTQFRWQAYTQSNGNSTATMANPFPDLDWHHFVGIFDGTTHIYKDGVLGGSGPTIGGTTQTGGDTQNWRIGSDTTSFDGRIDEVRIYNRALSAAEIKMLYDLGR